MPATAKLVSDDDGQTVRLPKEFRMPGDEVRIRREGDRVVLEPVVPELVPLDAEAWLAQFDRWRDIPFPEPEADGSSILDDPPPGLR